MSLSAWRRAFYDVPAEAVAADRRNGDLDLIAHSLRKWEGLKRENLDAHGLYAEGGEILWREEEYVVFLVDTETCALCQRHYGKEKVLDHPYLGSHECGTCPLARSRPGGAPCDRRARREKAAPFDRFLDTGDAKPMIRALQKARKWVEAQKKKEKKA